jgi:hypothetical protein
VNSSCFCSALCMIQEGMHPVLRKLPPVPAYLQMGSYDMRGRSRAQLSPQEAASSRMAVLVECSIQLLGSQKGEHCQI